MLARTAPIAHSLLSPFPPFPLCPRPDPKKQTTQTHPTPNNTQHPTSSLLVPQHPEHVRAQVLEAFGCWLRLSEGRGLPPRLEAHPLVSASVGALREEGTFHAAVDAVSCFVIVCCCLLF